MCGYLVDLRARSGLATSAALLLVGLFLGGCDSRGLAPLPSVTPTATAQENLSISAVKQFAVTSPDAIAFDLRNHRALVTAGQLETASIWSITVHGGASRLMSLPATSGPIALQVDPALGRIYVLDSGANSVLVVDGASGAIQNTFTLDGIGAGLALSADGSRLFVAEAVPDAPFSLLEIFDTKRRKLMTASHVGTGASALGLDDASGRLHLNDVRLTVVDPQTGRVIGAARPTTQTGDLGGLVVDPSIGRVFVADAEAKAVLVVDEGTNVILGSVTVGPGPAGVAIDTLRHRVYVVNQADDTLRVIDGRNAAVVGEIRVGARPVAVAVDSGSGNIFVANSGDNSVWVLRDA